MSVTPFRHRRVRVRLAALAGAVALAGSGVLALPGPARADAVVSISGPSAPVPAGTPYTYTVTDQVYGEIFGSSSSTFTVTLSGAAATFTGGTTQGDSGSTCTPNGAQITCTYSFSDEPGPPPVITTVTVQPAAAGTVTASVALTDGPVTGSDSTTTTITSPPFPFGGYLPPVAGPPTVNMVHAGQGVAVQFSLGGDQGMNILAAGSPTATQVSCSTGVPVNTATMADTAGGSGLQFDSTTGDYTYVWKTSKSWAGTCQEFTITLTDGTSHSALFQF